MCSLLSPLPSSRTHSLLQSACAAATFAHATLIAKRPCLQGAWRVRAKLPQARLALAEALRRQTPKRAAYLRLLRCVPTAVAVHAHG
eukprot:1648203-Pleurochrysis_carterae.AAC.1